MLSEVKGPCVRDLPALGETQLANMLQNSSDIEHFAVNELDGLGCVAQLYIMELSLIHQDHEAAKRI